MKIGTGLGKFVMILGACWKSVGVGLGVVLVQVWV